MGSRTNAGPSNVTIIGVAILLFTCVLLAVGMHHIIRTGTCSSNGYSDVGPVPTCPAGTGWWILFLMVGIFGGIIGGLMSASGSSMSVSPIFFGIFGGIGFGALSVVLDHGADSSTKLFGGIFGGSFALVGIGSGLAMLRVAYTSMSAPRAYSTRSSSSRHASSSARTGGGGSARHGNSSRVVTNAFHSASNAPHRSASDSSSGLPGFAPITDSTATDPLEQVQRLAELHKSGALTDQEFAAEKARILGE